MHTMKVLMPCAILTLPAALSVGAADARQSFVEKGVHGYTVRFPLLAGFAPLCEDSSEFAARARSLTPRSADFLTCAVFHRRVREAEKGSL